MTRFFKLSFIISMLAIGISCGGKDCSLLNDSFDNYKNALQTIKSSDFKFSDDCDTSKSSWIYNAEFYSCDGKTGYYSAITESMRLTTFFSIPAFFAFMFYPEIMKILWFWVPYV